MSVWRRRQDYRDGGDGEDSLFSNRHSAGFLKTVMNSTKSGLHLVYHVLRHPPRKYARLGIVVLVLCLLYLVYHVLQSLGIMYGNPHVNHWCNNEEMPDYMLRKEPDEITIVTAFVSLGAFKRGQQFGVYNNPYKYKQWMRPFGRMANPVLAFIEDDDDIEYFRKVRACLPDSHTKIIKYNRNELWSFGLLERVREVFDKPNYPKHYPNTAYPEYTCMTHSKYELLQKALDMDVFKTPAFAWLDISYFKDLGDSEFFKLVPPSKFNTEKVGFTQAWPHDPNINIAAVMRSNLVWVSGGLILGINETLHKFVEQYRWTVETLLEDELANADQQVIYAMFSTPMRHRYGKKQVKVHSYMCRPGQLGLYGDDLRRVCLGHVCKNSWEGIHKAGMMRS